ncbi:MAG TPA: hypothetical protein VGL97_00080 [Bryobacteraceae bacterium]|jgi:hypothetical protein
MPRKTKQRQIVTLEQWVEIGVSEGKTVTALYPSNAEMLEQLEEMDPAPELVYRRLNFREGVPAEYYWATSDAERRQWGGHGIQRMTVARWLATLAKEAANGDGHIGRCDEPMPRPKERGGCDCPVCTASQARLDREAMPGGRP